MKTKINKNNEIKIRIDDETKHRFKIICELKKQDQSKVIRHFIKQYIKEQILLLKIDQGLNLL